MLTLCYAPSYGIEICEARRLTTEEKRHYAAWFAETGFIGVGSHTDLPCISHEDLPNRSDDGSFLGCYNQAWIITEAEAASYEKLNRQRQNEKDLAQKAAQDAHNAKTADFETGYENCKKQFESWTVTDVKQNRVIYSLSTHLFFMEKSSLLLKEICMTLGL